MVDSAQVHELHEHDFHHADVSERVVAVPSVVVSRQMSHLLK